MSLSTGRGPLSGRPLGRFSAPLPEGVTYVEPFRRRVRAVRNGVTVIDTERVQLVHRQGEPPVYLFPAAEVGALPATPDSAADGWVRVPWDAVDGWYEEQQQVHMHPRNPYHRIDIVATRRHLRVEVTGQVLVDTDETTGLWETALEPRLYVSPERVRLDLLKRSDTQTYCPYKGTASYWTAVVGEQRVEDVAWSYEDPLPESSPIRGLLSFDPARAAVTQDLPPA